MGFLESLEEAIVENRNQKTPFIYFWNQRIIKPANAYAGITNGEWNQKDP